MITVIGWETTQEAIDRNINESRAKEAELKANPLVRKFESNYKGMRAKLNREIEDQIGRRWEYGASGDII